MNQDWNSEGEGFPRRHDSIFGAGQSHFQFCVRAVLVVPSRSSYILHSRMLGQPSRSMFMSAILNSDTVLGLKPRIRTALAYTFHLLVDGVS